MPPIHPAQVAAGGAQFGVDLFAQHHRLEPCLLGGGDRVAKFAPGKLGLDDGFRRRLRVLDVEVQRVEEEIQRLGGELQDGPPVVGELLAQQMEIDDALDGLPATIPAGIFFFKLAAAIRVAAQEGEYFVADDQVPLRVRRDVGGGVHRVQQGPQSHDDLVGVRLVFEAGVVDNAVKGFDGQHEEIVMPVCNLPVSLPAPQIRQRHDVQQRPQTPEQTPPPGRLRPRLRPVVGLGRFH